MPRKGHVKKRITPPDSVYASPAITKFINCLMLDGKKSTAERIFYGALDLAGSGGATYQVPVEVKPDRAQALAIRWIINFSRSRKGIPMVERLARELGDACKGEGGSVKKREDTHRIAEANRAFAHYRW